MSLSYLEAVSKGFPNIQCECIGDGTIYEDIKWVCGPSIPSKEVLDQWLLSNPIEDFIDTKITGYAFRKRFSMAEKIAMELTSIDNLIATMEQRQMSATIRVMLKDLDSAGYVDLSSPEIIDGIHMLEQFGIIQPNRANEILSKTIQEKERLT